MDLAFQVRQQTRALRSQNDAHALGRLAAVQARSSGDAKLANLFARGVRDPAPLSVEEQRRCPRVDHEASARWRAFIANPHGAGPAAGTAAEQPQRPARNALPQSLGISRPPVQPAALPV